MGSFMDMPPEEKCFVVFQGVPSVWYIHKSGDGTLDHAQEEAKRKTEETGESHTVMCVPKDSLSHSLTAVNHGVVFHATDRLDQEES